MQATQVLEEHLAAVSVGQSESLTHSTQVPPERLLQNGVAEKREQCPFPVHIAQMPDEHFAKAVEGQSESFTH